MEYRTGVISQWLTMCSRPKVLLLQCLVAKLHESSFVLLLKSQSLPLLKPQVSAVCSSKIFVATRNKHAFRLV
jgi:hypothetical protein